MKKTNIILGFTLGAGIALAAYLMVKKRQDSVSDMAEKLSGRGQRLAKKAKHKAEHLVAISR